MDRELRNRGIELDKLEMDDEIASRRMSIAQKKAVEREMRRKYGRDWRKVLGLVGKLKPNSEALQDLYTVNPELRDLNNPGRLRRL